MTSLLVSAGKELAMKLPCTSGHSFCCGLLVPSGGGCTISHRLCEPAMFSIQRNQYLTNFIVAGFLLGGYFGRTRLGCRGDEGGVKSTVTSTGRNWNRNTPGTTVRPNQGNATTASG